MGVVFEQNFEDEAVDETPDTWVDPWSYTVSAPSAVKVVASPVHAGNRAAQVYSGNTSTPTYASIQKNALTVDGAQIDYYTRITTTIKTVAALLTLHSHSPATNEIGVGVAFWADTKIKYNDGGSWTDSGITYVANTWYHIRCVVHDAARTYDLYIDNMVTPIATGIDYYNDLSCDYLNLKSGTNFFGSVYFDDLTITTAGEVKELAGTVAAQSALTANIKSTETLAGSIEAQSSLTGNVNSVTVYTLAGIVECQSTVEGYIEAIEILSGSIAVQSVLTGNLKAIEELVGSLSATSSLTGNIYAIESLAGLVAVQSTLTGNITGVFPLSGTVAAQAALTGNLYGIESLAGLIEAQSALVGNLSKLGTFSLSGSIAAQSALTGDIHTTESLTGLIAAQSGLLTGALTQRYSVIPPFMEKDLIDPYASGAWLHLVEIAVPGHDVIRIARNTEDVRYDVDDFEKFNLQIGEQIFSSDGSIPRVTLRIFQDINRKVEDIVNTTEGALGAAVKLIRVNEKWLTSPVTALEADYDNLASQSDTEWVTFTLGIPNPLTQRFLLRMYCSSMCPWCHPDLFKGPDCQLSIEHEDTTCTGTYEDCYVKGNAVHWGGELGLDPSVVKGKR